MAELSELDKEQLSRDLLNLLKKWKRQSLIIGITKLVITI